MRKIAEFFYFGYIMTLLCVLCVVAFISSLFENKSK